ncbi:hypothetical protein GOB27_30465 [Sinorhizobium meliloti]|nr:hypothetical protein [Sinorhizobium meliloti]
MVGTIPDLGRWVTLSVQTRRLIEDFWGCETILNSTSFALCGRRVMWSGDEADRIDEPLLAIETSSLAKAMLQRLRVADGSADVFHLGEGALDHPALIAGSVVIDARGRYGPPQKAKRVQHGARCMRVWRSLQLKKTTTPFGEIFAGRGFWSFAFPIGANSISLQIATPRRYLISELCGLVRGGVSGQATLLTSVLRANPDIFERESDEASTAPSLLVENPSSSYLPIGDALMTLDPLCGDGTGHGIKSALIATGVLNSMNVTVPDALALSHFVARSRFAYGTHLKHCRRFYLSMKYSSCWVGDVDDRQPIATHADSSRYAASSLKLVVTGIGQNSGAAALNPLIQLVSDRQL